MGEEKVGKRGMERCGGDGEGRVVNGTGRVSFDVPYILVHDTKQAGKRVYMTKTTRKKEVVGSRSQAKLAAKLHGGGLKDHVVVLTGL